MVNNFDVGLKYKRAGVSEPARLEVALIGVIG
jgi:hypothetical protein